MFREFMNIELNNISGSKVRALWMAIDYKNDMSVKKSNKIFLSNCAQIPWNNRCFRIIYRKKNVLKSYTFFQGSSYPYTIWSSLPYK